MKNCALLLLLLAGCTTTETQPPKVIRPDVSTPPSFVTRVAEARATLVATNPPATIPITLAWDASPSEGVLGYKVLGGWFNGSYTNYFVVGNVTTATVTGNYGSNRFAVLAYDVSGLESELSNEIFPVAAQETVVSVRAIDEFSELGDNLWQVAGPARLVFHQTNTVDLKQFRSRLDINRTNRIVWK